ncbi:Uncharacterised protein [Klebsiella pneumoniae]|nr:Uncharacterised protein [Klebsiella pneumoniae]
MLNNCLQTKRVIWTQLLRWLPWQKPLHSLKLSVKSKTALNKTRFEIEKATERWLFLLLKRKLRISF